MSQNTETYKRGRALDVDIAPAVGGDSRRTSTPETPKSPNNSTSSTEARAALAVAEAVTASPSSQEAGRRETKGNRMMAITIALAVLVWVAESALHALVFDGGSFAGQLFAPAAHELWMRGLWITAIIGFGAYVQHAIHERERSRAELGRSERSFRTLFDKSPIGIAVVDLEGHPKMCNPALERILGYSAEELASMAFTDFTHPDDANTDWQHFQELLAGERDGYEMEKRYYRKDGGLMWGQLSVAAVRNESGQPQYAIGMVTDITESRKMESAVRTMAEGVAAATSEEFFRSLVRYLANTLDMDFAIVGELTGDEVERVRTVAVCAQGEIGDNIVYELAGTPCENVVGKSVCSYPSGVQQQFPLDQLLSQMGVVSYVGSPLFDSAGRPLGIVAVLDGKPLSNPKLAESLLQMSGVRASTELERRRAEEAVVEEKNRAQRYLDVAGAMMLALGADGSVTMVNRRGCYLLRREEEEIVGKDWFDNFLPERMRQDVRAVFQMLMAGETEPVEFYESPVLTASGEERTLFWHNTLLRDEEGKIIGCLGSAEDVTERKRADEELRRHRDHLEELVEGRTAELSDANWQLQQQIADRQRAERIVRTQRDLATSLSTATELKEGLRLSLDAALEVSGMCCGGVYLVDQASGDLNLTFHAGLTFAFVESASHFAADSANALLVMAGQPVYTRHNELRAGLGAAERGEKLSAIGVIPLLHEGRVVGCLNVASHTLDEIAPFARDALELIGSQIGGAIARLETAEELRARYEEEKKLTHQLEAEIDKRVQFTRALAHELKTPLTPMIASSDMLVERIDDELLQGVAINLNRGALDLNSRIDELLDLARGEIGMLRVETEHMDLQELLGEVAEEVEPMLASIGQSLVSPPPGGKSPPLPLVCADRVRVKQVVLNLLNNAFKFTPEGGKISLSARQQDSEVIVEVRDSGPGIRVAERGRIFDPYYRLEGDRERLSGLGLGLALARMFVELHGGRIWVRSRRGRGSTFGFSLPIAEAGPGQHESHMEGDL